MGSGSQLVSTTATIGMPILLASLTAMASRQMSKTTMAPGICDMFAMPSRFRSRRDSSLRSRETSFWGSVSNMPFFFISWMARIRLTLVAMFRLLVSVPPSHRLVTQCWPHLAAASPTTPTHWRLVPTNRTPRPALTVSRRNSRACFRKNWVLVRSMMYMPLRLSKM